MLDVRTMGHISVVVSNLDEAEKYYCELFEAKTIATLANLENEGMSKNMGLEGLKLSEKIVKFAHCNLVLVLTEFHSPKGNSEIVKHQINDMGGPRHIGLNVENIDAAFDFLKGRSDVEILNNDSFRPVSYSKISADQFSLNSMQTEENSKEKERLAELLSKKKTFFFRDKYGLIWEIEERFFDGS